MAGGEGAPAIPAGETPLNAPAAPETPAGDTSPAAVPPWKRWLVLSPLARIAIFVAIAGALIFLLRVLLVTAGWAGPGAPVPQRQIGAFLLQVVPALTAYLFLVRVIERRRADELSWAKVLRDGPLGAVGGILLISAVVGVMWLLGSYAVTGTNPDPTWVRQLVVGGIGAAIVEEIMMRGVLFRISEEGLGTWGALVFSGLLFGFLHIGNQGATAWSSIAIAIEAGMLLGLVFHVSRSLPLCMGVHMGWNFAQGTIWGIPVSGGKDTGWLVSVRTGPDWLSGGAFGAEASVVAVVLCSVVSLALLAAAVRARTIVPPWFARRGAPAQSPGTADNDIAKATPSC
jgi:uncharacterized protein